MKKILAGLLALCLLSGLCACGGGGDSGRDPAPLPPPAEGNPVPAGPDYSSMTEREQIVQLVDEYMSGERTSADLDVLRRNGEISCVVRYAVGVNTGEFIDEEELTCLLVDEYMAGECTLEDIDTLYQSAYISGVVRYAAGYRIGEFDDSDIQALYLDGQITRDVPDALGIAVPEGPGDITAGPILMEGSFYEGFTAMQMDLSTGEMRTVFSFYNDRNYSFAFETTKQKYMSCYFTQQLFDEAMTKLAVSWYSRLDSSYHVGWVDRDGNLTDVTEILHPHTTDFSSKIPHDRYALFSPDGYFVFTDLDKECYCFVDIDTMTVVNEVPYMIDDSSYYTKEFGNTAYQVIFMPNGELQAMWHAKSSVDHFRDFGECYIEMPDSAELKTWDYLYDNKILCIGHDDEGYFIAEIGEGIGELRVLGEYVTHAGISCWNYAYHGDFTNHGRDGIEVLEITPHTDYRLESCAYSNGQIAFIGSRGSERFLFTVEEAENSNPIQIAPLKSSLQLLFWK